MATRIAVYHNISTSTLFSLVESESSWNPEAVSKTGDYGLVQINLDYWPNVSKEEAFNPEFALNFAAEKIAEGKEYYWVSCSCVQFARTLVKGVPTQNANKFWPNSKPIVGSLALFRYSNGLSHVAVVTAIHGDTFSVRESNYKPCVLSSREVSFDNPHLIGFWTP